MASLTFYGGINEIGGNKVLLRDGNTRVFLDFGMSFDRKGAFFEEFLQPRPNSGLRDLLQLGIAPRIDGIYREDLLKIDGIEEVIREAGCDDDHLWTCGVKSYDEVARERGEPFVQAVLVSHGHLDHFQHISLLDEKIPIFCSRTTKIIIEIAEALGKSGFESEFTIARKRSLSAAGPRSFFPGSHTITTETAPRQYLPLDGFATIGDVRINALPVDHSVPGATAFLITASDGRTIVYSGDIRFHGSRSDLSDAFRERVRGLRPDVLVVEGTRIEDDEPDSENTVEDRCVEIIAPARGLAMVGFAWKDVTRYNTMRRVAERTNRTLVISPKLAFLLHRLREGGGGDELDITAPRERGVRVYLKRKDGMLYSKADYVYSKYDAGCSVSWDRGDPSTIDLDHFDNGIRAYQICRDPSAYLVHLDYYEFNELLDLQPPPGSIYIRASSEPFSDEMKLDERRLKKWLHHFGINAPSHEPVYVHASGHASGMEIKQMIRGMNPGTVFPIHTNHGELFREVASESTSVIVPKEGVEYPV